GSKALLVQEREYDIRRQREQAADHRQRYHPAFAAALLQPLLQSGQPFLQDGDLRGEPGQGLDSPGVSRLDLIGLSPDTREALRDRCDRLFKVANGFRVRLGCHIQSSSSSFWFDWRIRA